MACGNHEGPSRLRGTVDVVTHVLAGYVVALGVALGVGRLRARWGAAQDTAAWAAVAGAAALAPDLDVLFIPLTLVDALYPLQHRGATHSVLGAPVVALLFVLALGAAGRRWPRLEVFTWRRDLVVPLLIGAWSHLLLDVITHQGAPLAWPLSEDRTSLEVYYWIIWWLAPFSFVPLWMRYRGRWDDRRVVQAAAVVVAIVLVVGAVRLAAKPDGEHVYATRDPLEWAVATAHGNGTWQMELVRGGRALETRWYEPEVPAGAQDAVDAVLATHAYRGFRFDSTAPHVAQAEPRPGGWNVTVLDIVQRFEADTGPDWLPDRWKEDAGRLEATVIDGEVRVKPWWR